MAESVQDTLARANALLTQTGYTGTRGAVQNASGQFVANPAYTAPASTQQIYQQGQDMLKMASSGGLGQQFSSSQYDTQRLGILPTAAPRATPPPPVTPTIDAGAVSDSITDSGGKLDIPDVGGTDTGSTDLLSIDTNLKNLFGDVDVAGKEKELKESESTMDKIFQKLFTKKEEQITAENEAGLPEMRNQLRNTIANIANLQRQTAAAMMISEDRLAPSFIIQGEQAQLERRRAIQGLALQAEAQLLQNNVSMAQSAVDRAIDLEFAPYEAMLDYQKEVIRRNENALTRADAKRMKLVEFALDERTRRLDEAKEDKKAIYQLALTTKKNFPNDPAAQAAAAKAMQTNSLDEAINLLGKYQQDPVALEQAKLNLENTRSMIKDRAETNRIAWARLELDKKKADETDKPAVTPQELVAYANEYRATGKIPSGLPKGTFGAVADVAKESPLPSGSMVNRNTGVTSTTVGEVEQKDYKALHNIYNNVKRLKKLDDQRTAGVVYGVFSNIFGETEAQSKYNTLRKAIIDDMQRMQSGAALTVDEVAFYEGYLPGKYSEPLGLGTDSGRKISSFESFIKNRLDERLASSDLVIAGYSQVDTPLGKKAVGDIITNDQGESVRVGPNGELYKVYSE